MTARNEHQQAACGGEGVGKVALVTGGSSGLGRATALALASAGVDVVVNYHSRTSEAEEVIAGIESAGRRGLAIKADVAVGSQVKDMVERAFRQFGRIDILVNNAGLCKSILFMDTTEEDWDRTMATNIKGVFNCCKAVIPHMIAQKAGRIINISSGSAITGIARMSAYSTSKAALLALTYTLARELGRYGILVNAVLPGHFHDTRIVSELAYSDEEWEKFKRQIPLRRFGQGEELADVVTFLALRGSYVTGVAIPVAGGMVP